MKGFHSSEDGSEIEVNMKYKCSDCIVCNYAYSCYGHEIKIVYLC